MNINKYLNNIYQYRIRNRGFTLIEVLIGISLFVIIGLVIFSSFSGILDTLSRNQWRADAISAIQNEIEIIRGMKYEDIGILDGYPVGRIPAEKNVRSCR